MKNKIVEHVSPEMIAATNAKFAEWDKVSACGITDGSSEEQKRKFYSLLQDPTIYAYAFFRNNDGLPWRMFSYQDMMLNDSCDRILFVSGNQLGKSCALCIKALHFAINNPGKTCLMSSKTFTQSKDLLRQIRSLLLNSTLDFQYDIGDTETKTEIYFRHSEELDDGSLRELPQSRIICVPATEAALGYPVHLLLIDELAFYEQGDYFYKQIAQPRTYATKGQIIIFSNPNGQQGILHELWNNPLFNKYRFNFFDRPGNTQALFDKFSVGLTREQIDSTLLAEFTNPAGGFFTFEERRGMQEERDNFLPVGADGPLYVFFDFAKVNDRTVRAIGKPVRSGKFIGVHVFEMKEYASGTSYDVVINDLKTLISSCPNILCVGWDNTGVGRGIEDFIKEVGILGVRCIPTEFSLENKSKMYTIFKLLAERNLKGEPGIKIPYVPECDKQLSYLRFSKSSRGYWMVHHEKESDRDDFADVLAGLCSLIAGTGSVPVSLEFV